MAQKFIEYFLNTNNSLVENGFPGFIHIFWAVLIFVFGRWLALRARRLFRVTMDKTDVHVNKKATYVLESIIYYGILIVAISFSLIALGVPISSILLIFSLFVVLVAVAFQTSLNNLAATIIFVIFQTFKPGDWVTLDGSFGQVKRIQLFATVIITQGQSTLTVPNGVILASNVTNYSDLGIRRVDIAVTIRYQDDLLKAKQIMEQVIAENEHVLAEPKPVVGVETLGVRGVEFSLRPFALPANYWTVMFEVTEQVKIKLSEAGIEIPVVQQNVHIIQD